VSCFARFGARGNAASNSDRLGPKLESSRVDTGRNPDASYSTQDTPSDGARDGKFPASKFFGSQPSEDGDENDFGKIGSALKP
jgi:hypothetical protein